MTTEMQEALAADAEKLEGITGRDHAAVSIGTVLIRAEIVENKHGRMIRVGSGYYFAFDEVDVVEPLSEKHTQNSDGNFWGERVGPPTEKFVKGIDIDDRDF